MWLAQQTVSCIERFFPLFRVSFNKMVPVYAIVCILGLVS